MTMNKTEQVLGLVNEIESTIVEAGEVKVGDAVVFKPGTKLQGVIAIVQNVHDKENAFDVRIGGGAGLVVAVPAKDLQKTAAHPGVLEPKA
jgi:hypothetical protein